VVPSPDSMLRVLLVTDTDKPIGDLRDALAGLGCEMLAGTATPQALHRAVQEERPDVIIIDTESPSRDTLEQLAVMHASAPRPVLMFSHDANQQLIREAVNAGVTAYRVEGLASERLAPILEVALARFAQESQLRERLAQAENELAERKLIDRAKRLLMDRQKLTEPAAYASLRKRAMNRGVKLAEAAREVVASAGSLK
jgi:two-component system, response regulator / RNA-binding antiterminator